MGRHGPYRPGSFYRNDDRTGFPQRAERTREQWDGLIVDERVWESRQPQDFVRGVRDEQAAPNPRPLPPATFVGPEFYTLQATAGPQANSINVGGPVTGVVGTSIGIMLDSGVNFTTTISSNGSTIGLAASLPTQASSGNVVTVYGVVL